jgi:hypothetical protein
MDGANWFIAAVGVANNPDPIPAVRGIDGTSRNNKRLAGVAEAFQVRKTAVELHVDEPSNVLANDPSGSDRRNDSSHFRPEITVICRASSLPGMAEGLAGESTDDNVSKSGWEAKGADVVMDRHPGEILSQHLAGPWINFTELDRAEPAGHPQAQAEAAYATEQV